MVCPCVCTTVCVASHLSCNAEATLRSMPLILPLMSCTALGRLLQGFWTVAFQDSMDALRFSHAAQMLLMYVPWTGVSRDYCGSALPSPDGRWLYIGPRVCMAIHESEDYIVSVGAHWSHVLLCSCLAW
jgi:hypothetical protein